MDLKRSQTDFLSKMPLISQTIDKPPMKNSHRDEFNEGAPPGNGSKNSSMMHTKRSKNKLSSKLAPLQPVSKSELSHYSNDHDVKTP